MLRSSIRLQLRRNPREPPSLEVCSPCARGRIHVCLESARLDGADDLAGALEATSAASRRCERLAEYGWKPHRDLLVQTNPITGLNLLICVKNRGLRFHRIRDFKQCYFNSIPPTSHDALLPR